jgi:uncharacterized protein (TIGR03067 family)
VLQLGSDTMKVNPAKASELTFTSKKPENSVEYIVIVRKAGKELARMNDVLAFRDAPGVKPVSKNADVATDPKMLDGFWVLEQNESKGNRTWPQHPEEALYIEDNKIQWVKKDGTLPPNPHEASYEADAGKNPLRLTIAIQRGPAKGQKWQAIVRIDGDRLTIATDCDADRCPSLFATGAAVGSAQFVRTYRRVVE